jgi:hypothetical protein
MKRLSVVVLTLLAAPALTALAACGGDEPATTPPPVTGSSATGGPSAAGSASPGPTASGEPVLEFTVDGAGPYQLDATLTALQTANLLTNVATGADPCPENTTARGTGIWADLELSFKPDGTLYLAINKSPTVPTPSGAWIGTPVEDLKKIYKGLFTREVTHGADTGFVVRTNSGRGILFALDSAKTVVWMAAADGNYLISTFQTGSEFC